jgi:hypothetical protein
MLYTREIGWSLHFTDRVNFLIVDFYTITCNFVTMKCYFFQSDFFLLIIQYNFLFFASLMQLGKFHLVIARSLFVGLTTPGDNNVISDGKRTIQITDCFSQFPLNYFARYPQSER